MLTLICCICSTPGLAVPPEQDTAARGCVFTSTYTRKEECVAPEFPGDAARAGGRWGGSARSGHQSLRAAPEPPAPRPPAPQGGGQFQVPGGCEGSGRDPSVVSRVSAVTGTPTGTEHLVTV